MRERAHKGPRHAISKRHNLETGNGYRARSSGHRRPTLPAHRRGLGCIPARTDPSRRAASWSNTILPGCHQARKRRAPMGTLFAMSVSVQVARETREWCRRQARHRVRQLSPGSTLRSGFRCLLMLRMSKCGSKDVPAALALAGTAGTGRTTPSSSSPTVCLCLSQRSSRERKQPPTRQRFEWQRTPQARNGPPWVAARYVCIPGWCSAL